MDKIKNNKYLIINIIAVALVLLVTALSFITFDNTEKTVAADDDIIEIKVDKVTTVSIYVFGEGVELVESTVDHDIYSAKVGSNVRLQAVNETRIFTDWIITALESVDDAVLPTVPDLTKNIINFDVTLDMSDLDVTVNRRNASATDYGKYMMDRFVIVNETELIALQNILAGSYEDSDFELYYENAETYNTNDKKDSLREDLRYGYFLISNNFTVFNEQFTGIGTKEKPFQGIVCGKNTKNSRIFITMTATEEVGESSYGLFKYLGNEALIRNLNVTTSIGINKSAVVSNEDTTIYAGGLAGVMDRSTLIDVNVTTSIGIESNIASKIYAGGLFGALNAGSGIDSISDVVYEGTESKWSIVSHKTNSVISAGYVAGTATDTYIKEVDVVVTDSVVDLKNDSTTNNYTNSKLYLGNIFGSYYALNSEETIDDIMIMGNGGESLRALTTNGDAVVGGLIGYVDANQTGILNIEKVYFRVLRGSSEYLASSNSTSDVTNLYAGGVIGFVNGTNVIALDKFKNRLETVDLGDDSTTTVANYLFEGDYKVRTLQNGSANETTNGKSIAGGLVGKGLINISGSNSSRSEIAFTSSTSTFLIEAVQSKLTDTTGVLNDKEHAAAALIFGSVGSNNLNIANINVYTNNTTIQTIREIGSNAMGDLHTGGFIGYADGSSFTNIGLYFNDSSIFAKSLSYEDDAKNVNTDTNSAFCGGFAGELLGNSYLTNIEFAGYNEFDFTIIGTNSNLESIQNTIPGGGDYKGENYIGGIVGRIKHTTIENCHFKGSENKKNYIRMSGHESPDSAFCGGVVGLIMTNEYNIPSSIIDCSVSNTEIVGNATCVIKYNNPDIYIGGIVGGAYIHATNSAIEIRGCSLRNSTVYALGNEIIATYAGGIIAGATWESSISIVDCYVTDSNVKSNTTTTIADTNVLESSSGGIIGMTGNATNVTISNCAIIDTSVDAKVDGDFTNISSYAAGISGFTESNTTIPTISNCYSNAIVTSNHKNGTGTSNVYAIAYKANIQTDEKDVNVTTTKVTFIDFTHNGYTFEVVSSEAGTYKVRNSSGNYLMIWNNQIYTNGNANWASTFTFTDGLLAYNGRYLGFNGTNATYSNTGYDFSSVNYKTEELVDGTVSITSNQTYFLKKNVKNYIDNLGTAIGTGPFNIPLNVPTNPYANYEYLYGFDGTGQKLYIEILDNHASFTVNHNRDQVVSVSSTAETTSLAHIWINIFEDGSIDLNGDLYKPNHENKEEAAKYGWFIFDYVLLYTGNITEISSDISNIDTSYTDGASNYEYNYDTEEDLHYLVNSNNALDKIFNNYIEYDTLDGVKEFTFKVYENMLALDTTFEITHFGANYKLLFVDNDGNIIEDAEFKRLYGSIEFELIQKHYSGNNDLYNLVYKPNEDVASDTTFYIRFIGGNNTISSQTSFKINLIANKLQLVGVTFADYTPPLNYYEDSNLLGSDTLPYYLHVNSITKFIPIFTKSNDLELGKKYILEENIEKCDYAINDATDLYFDILSSGELKTGATINQNGQLEVTHDGDVVTVYFRSVKEISASYSVVGADVEGLTKATDTTDFYFEQYIRSNYSGIPSSVVITVGSTPYDLTSNPKAHSGINIYKINKDGTTSNDAIATYDADAVGYVVRVDESLLTGDEINSVNVDITYPIVYTITFKLQCETFNTSISQEQLTRSYKIESGTSFKTYFDTVVDGKTIEEDVLDWAADAAIFGFVFTGFYLVDDANSIHSYGLSFEDLLNSEYVVNSSNTFYGRWSYLIELVEASGTHIKTGFNSAFMQEYIGDDFTRAIQIPINANQGYIFRVDTDSYYIGKAGVEAYVVTINDGNKVMTEVPLSTYQDNSSLYYIEPEYITGYLVIMTTVSNSEVIVGEHTSSLTENVTPEDGVITFKYIVNHFNEGNNQSYIYNLEGDYDYETLNKEFVLDFYKQSDHSDLKLPNFTEIRVYYNRYDNGTTVPSKTIVGTYITHNDDRVYLTEFKMLDLETAAFPEGLTFGESLGSNKSVTEVYYFTITPPNGYSEKVHHEMANYVVECGYCYEKATPGGEIEYLEGYRTKTQLANPNDLSDVVSSNNSFESARQYKIYHIIPTRDTSLVEETDGSYTFTDDLTYSIYDIILTDAQKLPDFNYISLYDDTRQSILESTQMSFTIKELTLRLGYRLGTVSIYGKTNAVDAEWEHIKDVEVTSAIYQDYIIDFSDSNGDYPYYYYKIDNISTNEIRVAGINVLSNVNGVLYEGNVNDLVVKEVVDGKYIYSLTHQIMGDSRHDGKTFMLAVQLESKTDSSIIISDIIGNIYIKVNDIGLDINHYVNLNDYRGKNTAYLNLSEIISTLNVNKINFNITIPDEYNIHAIQLLEVTNEYKPASGEVRVEYTNEHTHYYINGVCSCGDKDPNYESSVNEFAVMLVNDFNTSGGNNETTIGGFYSSSANNILDIWTNATMLHKYRWFLEYIKEDLTAIATANGLLSDANYLNAIELLNNMIGGAVPSSIFTRSNYTKGTELIRYYIDALINAKSVEQIAVPSEYEMFIKDYSNPVNREEFLTIFEKSKSTIVLAKYNDGGLVSGGFPWTTDISGNFEWDHTTTPAINVSYLCSSGVLSANNLNGQNKILLSKVKTGVYKVAAVANSGQKISELGVAWTHAIATYYPVDFVELYGDYVGGYILIDESTMPSLTTNTSIADYNAMIDLTYDGYFNATIVKEIKTDVDLTDADLEAIESLTPTIVVNPSFEFGKYIVNGVEYQYGETAFATIVDALTNAPTDSKIYVFAGTYSNALTISKSDLTIYGPNYDINGKETRNAEAVISNAITISANNVTINGMKLTGTSTSITLENVSNIIISHVYSDAYKSHTHTVNSASNTYPITIYSESAINGLTISDSYIYADLSGSADYRPIYLNDNIVSNVSIINNYIDNKNVINGVAVGIYKTAGVYRIENNTINFQSGNNTFYLGYTSNACTEMWIKDNYFTSDQESNAKVATIAIFNYINNTGSMHIVGNTFEYLRGGNVFNFTGGTGNIIVKYNHFKDCEYAINGYNEQLGNVIFANNYYNTVPTADPFLAEYNKYVEENDSPYTNEQRLIDYAADEMYNGN